MTCKDLNKDLQAIVDGELKKYTTEEVHAIMLDAPRRMREAAESLVKSDAFQEILRKHDDIFKKEKE